MKEMVLLYAILLLVANSACSHGMTMFIYLSVTYSCCKILLQGWSVFMIHKMCTICMASCFQNNGDLK